MGGGGGGGGGGGSIFAGAGGGGGGAGGGGGGGHFMVVPKQPSRSTHGPGLQSSGAIHPSRGTHGPAGSGVNIPFIWQQPENNKPTETRNRKATKDFFFIHPPSFSFVPGLLPLL